jgi:chromosome segregation ATPase
MQNLIYLILIVLSAGAGYMAGSWSGKDAQKALDVAKQGGEKIVEKRDTLQADLDAKLKEKKAEHDAELAERDAKFAAATAEFNKKVSDRDGRIAALERSSRSYLQRAADLSARLATAKPEEVAGLKAEIADLQAKARIDQAESRGNVCVKERVPADLLADLRVEKL